MSSTLRISSMSAALISKRKKEIERCFGTNRICDRLFIIQYIIDYHIFLNLLNFNIIIKNDSQTHLQWSVNYCTIVQRLYSKGKNKGKCIAYIGCFF